MLAGPSAKDKHKKADFHKQLAVAMRTKQCKSCWRVDLRIVVEVASIESVKKQVAGLTQAFKCKSNCWNSSKQLIRRDNLNSSQSSKADP